MTVMNMNHIYKHDPIYMTHIHLNDQSELQHNFIPLIYSLKKLFTLGHPNGLSL